MAKIDKTKHTCECGKKFTPKEPGQKYCSTKCWDAAHAKKGSKT